MSCCVCNGATCCHVGPCSLCYKHDGSQTLSNNIIKQYPLPPMVNLTIPRDITVEELKQALDRLGLKAVPK